MTFLQISEARGGKSLRFRNFFTRPFAQTVPSSWIEKMKQTNIDKRSRYFSLVEVIILENWGLPAQIKRTQFISKAINLHLNRLHRTACAQSVFFGCFVYFSPLIFQHPLVVLSVKKRVYKRAKEFTKEQNTFAIFSVSSQKLTLHLSAQKH